MARCVEGHALASYSVFVLVVVLLSTEYTKAKEEIGRGIPSGKNRLQPNR